MSALFAKTVKQALNTFDQKNVTAFTNNFKILKTLANQLTVQDLNLNTDLFADEVFQRLEKAPCTYVHILQTKNVSMSVFILRKDYTMPLHDHPMMHGILRGLYGTLLVKSYTKIPVTEATDTNELTPSSPSPSPSPSSLLFNLKPKEINVISETAVIVTNSTECAILTPTERNFHEITALNGVAAFFDILSPPYDSDIPIYGRRKCSFYQRIKKNDENSMECTLIRIPSPLSYYCDTGEYNRPDFIRDYEKEVDNTKILNE